MDLVLSNATLSCLFWICFICVVYAVLSFYLLGVEKKSVEFRLNHFAHPVVLFGILHRVTEGEQVSWGQIEVELLVC